MNILKLSIILFLSSVSAVQGQNSSNSSTSSYFDDCSYSEDLATFEACIGRSKDKCTQEQESIAYQCRNLDRVVSQGLLLAAVNMKETLAASSGGNSESAGAIDKGGMGGGSSDEGGGRGRSNSSDDTSKLQLLIFNQTKINELIANDQEYQSKFLMDISDRKYTEVLNGLTVSEKESIKIQFNDNNSMDYNTLLNNISKSPDFLQGLMDQNNLGRITVNISHDTSLKVAQDYISNNFETVDSHKLLDKLNTLTEQNR